MTNPISSQTASLSSTKNSGTASISDSQKIEAQGQVLMSASTDQKQPSKKEAEDLVNHLNELAKPAQTSIQFKLYEKLNEYYVQVIDDTTKSVIKEIPSKELLDSYATMLERVGMMVDQKI
jgi:flagellar protein FlaG